MYDVTKKEAHIVRSSKRLVDWLLSLNQNNRTVRKRHVEWLAEAMRRGEFMLTAQGISVSKEGILLDGQHRLMALREADYPACEMVIVTGLEEKSQVYIDQHFKRSTSDMLKLALDRNVSARAASLSTFMVKIKWVKGGEIEMAHDKPPLAKIVEYMEEHWEIICLVLMACGNNVRVGAMGALIHYAQMYGIDSAITLGEQLRDGVNLGKDDPAYRLRAYLSSYKSKGGSAQLETYKTSVTACITHAKGERISHLRASSTWKGLPTPPKGMK